MQAQVMDTDKKTDAPSKIERKSSSVMSASQVENSKKVGGAKKRSFEPVNQMVPVEKTGVDTLSLLDRIALRTNTVDWALLIPNFGAEFDIKNTNDVKELQMTLTNKGFNCGAADGIVGDNTINAMFQALCEQWLQIKK
jgi:hypothetical protein